MNKMEVIDAADHVELGVADDVIGELRTRLVGRKADTHAGYEMVSAGIAEVTRYRTGVGKAGKELKVSALAFQKKVNVEVSRVTDLLLEIEMPLREEKERVDNEAARIREENEAKEHLAIKARERAEREVVEAEEEAKRESDRKEREAADAKLNEDRRALGEERRKMEEELRQKNAELAVEREKLKAEKRAYIQEKARIRDAADAVERDEWEAVEAAEQKVRDREERAKAAEAETVQLAKEEVERVEQLPDREKLKDFARRIEEVGVPRLTTAWGNGVFAEMCEHLQSACDVVYELPNDGPLTEDDLAAAGADETASQQSPEEES